MYKLGDVITSLPRIKDAQKHREGKQKCMKCGAEVEFAEDQWRKPCQFCGTVITISQTSVKKSDEKKEIQCFICMDTGLINYEAQNGGMLDEYVARCYCSKGELRKEVGIPAVSEVQNIADLRYMSAQNKYEYEKRKGKLNC